MAYLLSVEELEELKKAFNVFDKDGSGTITVEELGEVMRALGERRTEEELKEMINEADFNKTGTVEYTEFIATMTRKLKDSNAKEFKDAFRAFDKDGNGFISQEEMKEAMKQIGERLSMSDKQIDELIDAHKDNSGRVNYHAVVKQMSS